MSTGAVPAARRAFDDGPGSVAAPRERKALLFRLADLIERDREPLATILTTDVGKPITEAHDEVALAISNVRYFAEAVDKVYGEVAPVGIDGLGIVSREPVGLVGTVLPWNYPLTMSVNRLAPALAAANTVVIKPAEQAPLAVLAVAALVSEAGFPDGVVNVIPGVGEVAGQANGRHMKVDFVGFTGSSAVGKLFPRYRCLSS